MGVVSLSRGRHSPLILVGLARQRKFGGNRLMADGEVGRQGSVMFMYGTRGVAGK